jgi:putative ABC transport system ATP-binding protein
VLEVRDATKAYTKDGRTVHAAERLSLRAEEGDLIVVHGPSGSGKSTLLMMIGGMLPPDAGAVVYDAVDVYQCPPSKRNAYRRRTVGFVFQRFHLMPYLSVYDNIRMPLALQGRRSGAKEAIRGLARRLGIEERLGHRPAELSVGEQQRAALARALVAGQKLILADEPTGNLDPHNAEVIAQCLRDESRRGRIVLLATHDALLLSIATKRLRLESRRVLETPEADEAPTRRQKP